LLHRIDSSVLKRTVKLAVFEDSGIRQSSLKAKAGGFSTGGKAGSPKGKSR
jgi:hypothetical protein